MFVLLTRVLLWLLILGFGYYLIARLIPRQYLAAIGGFFLFIIIVVAFLNPSEELVSTARLVSVAGTFLSFPFKPLGLSIILLFLALTGTKKGTIKTSAYYEIWTALMILLLASTPVIAYNLARQVEFDFVQLERQRAELCPIQCAPQIGLPLVQPASTIVVLGHGTAQGTLAHWTQAQVSDIGSRLIFAAQVYREQLALGNRPLMLVTVSPKYALRANKNLIVNNIPLLLSQMGVPPERILLETRGVDLHGTAVQVEKILKQYGLVEQPVILVSSALNSHRAKLTFSQLGINAVARPADFYSFQPGVVAQERLDLEDLIPSSAALTITTRVIEEYLASIYYFLRGWLSP